MYKIVRKEVLSPVITLMEVEAPRLAASAKPGQFLIVRSDEEGERIPLTICDYNSEKGTVTIVTQAIGASSKEICAKEVGEHFADVVGPLGQPSEFIELPDEELAKMSFVFVAGGLGTAPVYPQAKYFHDKGAKVDVILGAKNAEMVILEKEMSQVCDNLYICTDDGSKGFKGLVTAKLEKNRAETTKFTSALKEIIVKNAIQSSGLPETSKELTRMFDVVCEMEPLLETNINLGLFFSALTSKLMAQKN